MSRITLEEIDDIAAQSLPIVGQLGLKIEKLGEGKVTARLPYNPGLIRPGGTIAGPWQMALADYAMYALVLSGIGRVELAVTINLNINFLRKPGPADIIGEGRMIKLGRRLAVSEVTLYSEGDPDPVAHVTGTYSIPPEKPA